MQFFNKKEEARYDESFGMKKKWLKHLYSKRQFFGAGLVLLSVTLFFGLFIIWSQWLWVLTYNSMLQFDVVHDRQDQRAGYKTYKEFVYPSQEEGSDVYSYYIFHVTNPDEVLLLGYKPDLQQTGPYGYRKREFKYDVQFSSDDSQYVNFKTYSRMEPVTNLKECRDIYFNMNLANFQPEKVDCPGSDCDCRDHNEIRTMVNPSHIKLLNDYQPGGIMSLLVQQSYQLIHETITTDFIYAVKGQMLSNIFQGIFEYRRAFIMANELKTLYDFVEGNIGTNAAVEKFTQSHLTNNVQCAPGMQAASDPSCRYGVDEYLNAYYSGLVGINKTALTYTESAAILGVLPTTPSIALTDTQNGGLQLWFSSGRYRRSFPSYQYYNNREDAENYEVLKDTFCSLDTMPSDYDTCEWKIKAVLEFLKQWIQNYRKVSDMVVYEWIEPNPTQNVECDTNGKTCNWQLNSWKLSNFYTPGSDYYNWATAASGITNNTGAEFINPALAQTNNYFTRYSNLRSRYLIESWEYCELARMNKYTDCSALDDAREFATQNIPDQIDLGYNASFQDRYDAGCGLSSYLWNTWLKNNDWIDEYVAGYYSQLLGYNISKDYLEDIGYIQWGSGAITWDLLGVASVGNIEYYGHWKFVRERYYGDYFEFISYAALNGYPHMSLTLNESKILLQALATESNLATLLRKTILDRSTTAIGDGTINQYNFGKTGDRGFEIENNEADFRLPGPFYDASVIIDKAFISDALYCVELESWYTSCQRMVELKVSWITNCGMWQTLASDPGFGIVCDATHINDYYHPHQMKVGNMLELQINDYFWNRVLVDKMIICDDIDNCDFRKGGLFVTNTVRNLLFEGYPDPLRFEVLNKEFKKNQWNVEIQCTNDTTVAYTDTCDPIPNNHCNDGFKLNHSTLGEILRVERDGINSELWYQSEIEIPYNIGSFYNPVTAMYPGDMVDDEEFQKKRDCEREYLGGKGVGAQTKSCISQMVTGRNQLDDIGRLVAFFGNTSFCQSNDCFDISGTEGYQFAPFVWEGIRYYELVYDGRFEGKSFSGENSVSVFIPEELIQIEFDRYTPADASVDFFLRYPTKYSYWDNQTTSSLIRMNKYKMTKDSWAKMRDLTGKSLKDTYGMEYEIPLGMISTHHLSGFPSVVSSPHHYLNTLYGGKEFLQVKGLIPDEKFHAMEIDIDPISGKAIRFAKRLQIEVRLERTVMYKKIISSQNRCEVPTKKFSMLGYGCFAYIPVVWYDHSRIMDRLHADQYFSEFIYNTVRIKDIATKSFLISIALLFVGLIILCYHYYRLMKHKKKIFID